MKPNIRMSELGYYHPSNANWSYHIYFVENLQGDSFKVKSTFGAESRLKQKLIELGCNVDMAYIGQFEMKYRDIAKLLDMDNDDKEIIEKLTRQQTHFNQD